MNSASDDVVDKLMHVSIETRELIETCEKASEESKLFKSKSEVLEEEVRRVSCENETLKRENQKLRDKLRKQVESASAKECWTSVVENANRVLNNVAPNVVEIMEKSRTSENARVELERELVALKKENANLRVEIEEKDAFASKQGCDFLNIKKMVDDYQLEISRLDAELKDCHSRVSTLNENLEVINAENLDLAEYTNFKSLLKKLGTKEDANEAIVKFQTLYEIQELFDKKLSPHIDSLAGGRADCNLFEESDENSNVASKVKHYLEKALYVIEKLNENNSRSSSEYESVIRAKDDEIAKLKELSCHLGLYNEILEKTLKQCRENAKMDKFVEERTDRLMAANKVLHDNFLQLRRIYGHSHRYNDQLFAEFGQLRLWCRILKIRVDKITRRNDDDLDEKEQEQEQEQGEREGEGETSRLPPLRDFFRLMDELFDQVAEKRADFDRQMRNSNQVLASYEASLVANDYLKSTVDNMTLEVKRLTCQVEQQMSEKIREIESLKGEMDSVKTDNRQLANKIKNCNREIISLSTENYDLNEKLSIFSRIENNCETLKSELLSAKSELDRYENWRSAVVGGADKFARLRDSGAELKRQNVALMRDVSDCKSTCGDLLQRTIQLVNRANTNTSQSTENAAEARKCQVVDLTALQAKCLQFKRDNQNLKVAVQSVSRQCHDEISSLKTNLHDALVSPARVDVVRSDLVDLFELCRDLKQRSQQAKDTVRFSPLSDTIEAARVTLSNKLENVSGDLNRLQSELNATTNAKIQYEQLVSTRLPSILKITQDLKSSRKLLSNSMETLISDFAHFSSATRLNIQEAVTRTIEHVKSSIALSNEEVIKEMQEVNSELKNRGETIFALNQRVDELVKDNDHVSRLLAQQERLANDLNDQVSGQRAIIVEKESELSKLADVLEKTKDLLHSKEDIISNLENEISKVKDIQAADGDVSSMGNISRTEEASRLRDVEDSFEERYMKLRCIAVKMKKSIADLNQQLKNEKSERNAIQSKLNVATEQAKRNQALQEECDRITDELELKTKEIKELKKIIVEADKKGEKSESLTKQYEILSTQKNELEMEKKILISSAEQAKKEKFVQETQKKEMEKELQRLKQKLKEYEDSTKKIQNDLEQANIEARKRDTLTLEMRDYEKTISDLTGKLLTKSATVDELNEKLKASAQCNVSSVERIKALEEQIFSFGVSSKIADEQILNLNRMIAAQEKDVETKDNLLKQSKQQVEEEKSRNERLRLELSESVIEVSSLKERLKNVQESSNSQLKSLQNRVNVLEEQSKKKDSQFDKLKEDFEAYKIRAHNVLQKHKNENNLKNNEEKLKMKIDDLSQTVKELRKRLDDTLVDLDNHKTELRLLDASKEKLHSRMKEMQEACAEKTRELDNINVEFKSYKLNNDTLIECYKNEIENLRISSQELSVQLENLKSSKECEIANDNEQNNGILVKVEKKCDDVSAKKPDSRNRSENNLAPSDETRAKSQNHELLSLEKLLRADITEETPVSCDTAELKKNIETLENQVAHLNRILNESEKNAARSEQHVAWLKDVNRRLQKTIDRAPHLQNGEYLKNVLFNFLTFPDGEEKCKLITILETLLQLTADEKGVLSSIAKGNRNEQKRSSGLASFLKLG